MTEFYQQFCREIFRDDGTLAEFEVCCADNYNFGYDVVDVIAETDPDRIALIWRDATLSERFLTFGEIARLSNQTANRLRAAGIKSGDRILLMLKQRWEYWYMIVALHKLNAIAVPVSFMLTGEDITYRINRIGASAVICVSDTATVETLAQVKKTVPTLQQIWSLDTNAAKFPVLPDEIKEYSETLERLPNQASDPAFLYFTSGTTGNPKAVLHDHRYTLAHILTAKYWQQVEKGGVHLTIADTGWAKASWGKIYGQWLLGSAVLAYDSDLFDTRQLVALMNQYRVTSFCAPPTVYRYMVKRGPLHFTALHHAASAGESLPPEISRLFEEQTGLSVTEGYGQTEMTLSVATLRGMKNRRGVMGKPTPLYDVKIVRDDGTETDPNEPGEIVIYPRKNQAGLMIGYVGTNLTVPQSARSGVFPTGDIAERDKDGWFTYIGRADDIIKTGGFRVGPVEIEHVLQEHPQVLDCSVVGVPDRMRGQAIQAMVVLVPDAKPSPELENGIKAYCNERLAVYKHIRRIVFVSELPKTFNGKSK